MPEDAELASEPAARKGADFLCTLFSPCLCVSSLLYTKSRCVTINNLLIWAAFSGARIQLSFVYPGQLEYLTKSRCVCMCNFVSKISGYNINPALLFRR